MFKTDVATTIQKHVLIRNSIHAIFQEALRQLPGYKPPALIASGGVA
jgi:hypothetical protein